MILFIYIVNNYDLKTKTNSVTNKKPTRKNL